MPYQPKLPDPSCIIKIVMQQAPEERVMGEGLYELRHGMTPKDPHYFDIIGLANELKIILPGMEESILDRLQNFHQVYINTKTREITI